MYGTWTLVDPSSLAVWPRPGQSHSDPSTIVGKMPEESNRKSHILVNCRMVRRKLIYNCAKLKVSCKIVKESIGDMWHQWKAIETIFFYTFSCRNFLFSCIYQGKVRIFLSLSLPKKDGPNQNLPAQHRWTFDSCQPIVPAPENPIHFEHKPPAQPKQQI